MVNSWLEADWNAGWVRVQDHEGKWHEYRRGDILYYTEVVHIDVWLIGSEKLMERDGKPILQRDNLPEKIIVKQSASGPMIGGGVAASWDACFEYMRLA